MPVLLRITHCMKSGPLVSPPNLSPPCINARGVARGSSSFYFPCVSLPRARHFKSLPPHRARENLKSNLPFGSGLKYGLSGALPIGQVCKESCLPGREIYLPRGTDGDFRALNPARLSKRLLRWLGGGLIN